ncbi:MAG TPA: peptidoglycan-binding domain-containing protein [Thermoanaerobaculia bacterium]|jgi:N-acetylmuramoyl-L-alanine amidase|nr:peptidoglycan-binding domain-containing protein [Thermoanaerobaculia bacterium]
MPRHVIRDGQGISWLALQYGFAPATIWKANENDALRELRSDGDLLVPGDVVHIPERRPKQVSCAVNQVHRFRRVGVPALMEIQLYRDQAPRSQEPFELWVDGVLLAQGRTDEDGVIKERVPPSAQRGLLVVGDERQEMRLAFGRLRPETELTGIQQRLQQLGYYRGSIDGAPSRLLTSALRSFQQRFQLRPTGTLDDATRARIVEVHDARAKLREP